MKNTDLRRKGICVRPSNKRPSKVSKETEYSVKRDLVQCQKRPVKNTDLRRKSICVRLRCSQLPISRSLKVSALYREHIPHIENTFHLYTGLNTHRQLLAPMPHAQMQKRYLLLRLPQPVFTMSVSKEAWSKET